MTETSGTPPNPFSPRQIRNLKISIAVMTILIVLGICALIFGMARQASRIGTKPAAQQLPAGGAYAEILNLGPGEVRSVSATNDIAVIAWKGETREVIISYDLRTGRELGRIIIPRQQSLDK